LRAFRKNTQTLAQTDVQAHECCFSTWIEVLFLSVRVMPIVGGLLALLIAGAAEAATYPLASDTQIIGDTKVVQARAEETLMDIARAHSMGHSEIRQANPDVDIWMPGEDTPVIIPSRFVLPDAPREGLVLNLSEMRLYYFHKHPETGASVVTTYPIGIGRADRQTPTGSGHVTTKLHKPTWYPTKEVIADYASRGKKLAATVPPGPDNPLGEYALMLSLPGYLIHGTNLPDGVGMRVSQGCVRLYPEHIKALAAQVPKGTPVTIVDQPYKIAIVDGQLVLEVHPPVYPQKAARRSVSDTGHGKKGEQDLIRTISRLAKEHGDALEGQVDWDKVTRVFHDADGIPTAVMAVDGDS
jgi:L,D-transpeptidase ErfK/SrfK